MNKMIGLCIEKIHTPSNVRLIKAIYEAVKAQGDTLIAIKTTDVMYEENVHRSVMGNVKVDGIIIEASSFIQAEKPVAMASNMMSIGKKVVLIDPAIEQRQKGIPYISFSDESSFRLLMQHLINDRGCKTIDLLAGEVLRGIPDEILDIYQEELACAGIPYDENRIAKSVAWNGNLRRLIDRLLSYDRPDAVICMDDRAANYIKNILANEDGNEEHHTVVCSVDRGYVDKDTLVVNTGIKRSATETAAETVSVLEQLLSGNAVEVSTTLDNVLIKSMDGTTDLVRERRARRRYGELEEEVIHWSNAEVRQHAMMAKILDNDSIDDISDCISRILPKESCFAVPSGFLENTNGSRMSDDESYVVFADRRKDAAPGKVFLLNDLEFEGTSLAFVFPVRTNRSQISFLLYQGQEYNRELYVLERLAVNLSDTFWRYFEDRELQFANRELLHANERMRQLQVRDTVTGMFNQRGFLRELEQMKERALGEKENIILIAIDLEGLSKINNIYGHSEGDAAILALADIIDNSLKTREVSAHIGADEFAVATIGGAEAEHICQTIIKSILLGIENYNRISGKEYSIEVNYVENKIMPVETTSMKKFLDDTLSEKRIKKNNQRNILPVSNTETVVDADEKAAVLDLINHNKFRYAFQPIINAKNGEIYAYEALMRSSEEKNLSPFVVLKYATLEKRLYDIERSTFFNVLALISASQKQLAGRRVFINSIPQYMLDDSDYEKLVRSYGTYLSHITVEVTEQTELDDRGLDVLMKRSVTDGFDVAIDDYGTGFANTSTLLRYLPNCVKIDRLLITGIQEDPKKQHFVKNIIEFAHDNGFKALAEGVETLAELKAVIQMDVDLIQGYYTAKPDFNFLQELPKDIRMDIVNANIKSVEHKNPKAYMVAGEQEIPLMRFALEGYTSIVLSGQDVTIYGNPDYMASMLIKVKDGTSNRLTLRNVKIESESGLPCIDIGKNASLTLNIEGKNEINEIGIRVPETATLRLEGDGVLNINAKDRMSYGIGNDMENGVGNVILGMSGDLNIAVDGYSAIGVGGGIFRDGMGIAITAGGIHVSVSGTECIGMGSSLGAIPIDIKNASLKMDIKAERGHSIGSVYGKQNVRISSAMVDISGAGDALCGIGSLEESGGSIEMIGCNTIVNMNARKTVLVGVMKGALDLEMKNARMELSGEGTEVLGVGTKDEMANIDTEYSSMYLKVRSGDYVLIGAKKENCRYKGGERVLQINSDRYEIPATEPED